MIGRELTKDEYVDHINHCATDNRRSNLRLVTNSQNMMNMRKRPGTTSRYKGVSWHKGHQKWYARIMIEMHMITLGYFNDEKDAAKAYDAAAKQMFLSFCALNFPEEEQGTA